MSEALDPIGAVAEPYALWAIQSGPGVRPVCEHADLLVIGNRDSAAKRALELVGGKKPVVDLVRVEQVSLRNGLYNGICW